MDDSKELQVTPEVQPLQIVNVNSLEATIKNAEKYVAAQDAIRKMALRVTSITDWVDEGGKPYLQWSGTAKVARTFGVSYSPVVFEKEIGEDERGKFVVYHCAGNVMFNGQSISEIGTGSSRDSFFGVRTKWIDGKKEKYDLPLSEIDLTDVKKKAQTNFLNRGLKSLLGLSFTWDEISASTNGRITRDTVNGVNKGVTYQQPAQKPAETPQSKEAQAIADELKKDPPVLACVCGTIIKPEVHAFSMKKYGKPLCFPCQKQAEGK